MDACTFNLSSLGRGIRSQVFSIYDKVSSAVDSFAKKIFATYFSTIDPNKSDQSMARTLSIASSQEMKITTAFPFSVSNDRITILAASADQPISSHSTFNCSSTSMTIPTGLINPKNNCFLNSVFQVLIIGNPDVRNAFMKADSKICQTDSLEQKNTKEIRLAIQTWIGQYEKNQPLDLSSLRSLLGSQWVKGQQDPQELFGTLIGYLDDSTDECSSLFIKTRRQRLFNKEPGYERPTLSPTESKDPLGSIAIPFVRNQEGEIVATQANGMIYLQNLLYAFHFEGGGYSCRIECIRGEGFTPDLFEETRVVAQEIVQFNQPMNHLVVPIKRFEYIGESLKIDTPIQVSERISLGCEYFVNQESADYELSGFIAHEGVEADSGHYVSYVSRIQNGVKKYFQCDDTCITSISRDDFLEAATLAYILDFHRI